MHGLRCVPFGVSAELYRAEAGRCGTHSAGTLSAMRKLCGSLPGKGGGAEMTACRGSFYPQPEQAAHKVIVLPRSAFRRISNALFEKERSVRKVQLSVFVLVA